MLGRTATWRSPRLWSEPVSTGIQCSFEATQLVRWHEKDLGNAHRETSVLAAGAEKDTLAAVVSLFPAPRSQIKPHIVNHSSKSFAPYNHDVPEVYTCLANLSCQIHAGSWLFSDHTLALSLGTYCRAW